MTTLYDLAQETGNSVEVSFCLLLAGMNEEDDDTRFATHCSRSAKMDPSDRSQTSCEQLAITSSDIAIFKGGHPLDTVL